MKRIKHSVQFFLSAQPPPASKCQCCSPVCPLSHVPIKTQLKHQTSNFPSRTHYERTTGSGDASAGLEKCSNQPDGDRWWAWRPKI